MSISSTRALRAPKKRIARNVWLEITERLRDLNVRASAQGDHLKEVLLVLRKAGFE